MRHDATTAERDGDKTQMQHPVTQEWILVSRETGRMLGSRKRRWTGVPLFKKEA